MKSEGIEKTAIKYVEKEYKILEMINVLGLGMLILLLGFGFAMKDSIGVHVLEFLPTDSEMGTGVFKPGVGFFIFVGIIFSSIIAFLIDVISGIFMFIMVLAVCGILLTTICIKISGIIKNFNGIILSYNDIKIQNIADILIIIVSLVSCVVTIFLQFVVFDKVIDIIMFLGSILCIYICVLSVNSITLRSKIKKYYNIENLLD